MLQYIASFHNDSWTIKLMTFVDLTRHNRIMKASIALVTLILVCWTDDVTSRVVVNLDSSGSVRGGRLDLDQTPNVGLCRRCICRMNGCLNHPFLQCLTAGPLCCCCLPNRYQCLNMEELTHQVQETATRGIFDDLEQGLEDIGQLEK